MLAPNTLLQDRYLVVRLLGQGGMGAVYEAEQATMRRHVALKVLYPSITNSATAVERFQRAYNTGQITFGERYNKVIDAWTHANNDVAEAMVNNMRKSRGGFNPVFMMFDSGSRGSRSRDYARNGAACSPRLKRYGTDEQAPARIRHGRCAH